jgi:hypothetical protein
MDGNAAAYKLFIVQLLHAGIAVRVRRDHPRSVLGFVFVQLKANGLECMTLFSAYLAVQK